MRRNIENGYAISSLKLLIDQLMLRHIKICAEREAHHQLGKDERSTTLDELDAFISILYARGINSWILYKEVTGKKLTRREYLQRLIEELRSAYIHKRKYKSDTQTKADTTEEAAQMRKRAHCQTFKRRNKTVDICSDCKTPIGGNNGKYIKEVAHTHTKCA
ncbi:hypothetical protein TNCV_3896961 [Trichonephila clavipes]|nr:hypothetical protein TNCV_3896961 [Trichonephila clavipes]